jgi:2',3'-cyclic-nucleotide 2'-phosphodiesterase (5'-nucleotidase family)
VGKLLLILLAVVILLVLTTVSPACNKSSSLAQLTILHTNDTHVSLDDIGRRAIAVERVRHEKGRDHVLLTDSGDVFNGTLYFTVAQGQADLWFMNKIGYEAMYPCNHEFDKGPAVLASFVSQASFPVLCANFDFSREASLAGKISPWTIKKVEKNTVFLA